MKLLIVSNMAHYQKNGELVGWGPTVQEIDYLSTLFEAVRHIGCLHNEPAPPSALAYQSPKIEFIGVPPSGGSSVRDKVGILGLFPRYLQKIRQELPSADVVHVRCPANISLLAIIWLALTRQAPYRWVKYAGNWKPTTHTPFSYNLQRFWLSRGWQRGVTTVNGRWQGQPGHIYSFHNPCLTAAELSLGWQAGEAKELTLPVQLIFVGAVNASKGIWRALKIADSLHAMGIPFKFNILGDGDERVGCEAWITEHNLEHQVHFQGWLPKPDLAQYYAKAHIFLLPSASEGWPKVLSEAMAYGVVPLASTVSAIPQILEDTGAGLAIPAEDTQGYVSAIKDLIQNPGRWKNFSQAGVKAAHLFTYDHYLASVRGMFKEAWGVNLPEGNPTLRC